MEERKDLAAPKGAFRCPRCGSVTWGNLQFCSQCGESLDIECQECGTKWRYIYAYTFCPSCGAKLKRKGCSKERDVIKVTNFTKKEA